jgi:hypothetical protein
MINTKEDFQNRVKEIDIYFDFLTKLDVGKVAIEEKGAKVPIDADLIKILKANGFLLLYNLMESACLNSLTEIFISIKQDKIGFRQLTESIQRIWLDQQLENFNRQSPKDETIQKRMHKISSEILQDVITDLNKKYIRISGNIDAKKIREFATEYGFQIVEGNGDSLLTVKEKRNHLAHGNVTFAECGKQFSVQDMIRHKEVVVNYLQAVIENIEKYILNKEYKVKLAS